jgi:hypothetical protein
MAGSIDEVQIVLGTLSHFGPDFNNPAPQISHRASGQFSPACSGLSIPDFKGRDGLCPADYQLQTSN